MASQPIFAPYIPLPSAAPRPNIRIAYIAGDASIAIHRGMATFPPAVRESTLEELAIAGLTDELIAAGRELLSPAMFAAFLHWGQTASHFCSHYDTDEEGERRADAHLEASNAIASLPAKNVHDLLFKVRLLNTEAGDCPDFGPVDGHAADGWKLPKLIEGVGHDMPVMSPLIGLIDQLCTIAWDYSPKSHLAIDVAIGAIITGAFRAAREALDSDPLAPIPVPAILDGYSPYMRGPLIAWQKQHERVRAAQRAAARPNHINPDAINAVFDELDRLWLLPAPGPSELAVKLQLLSSYSGIHQKRIDEIVERLVEDARRFGKHGPFLQSDGSILAAFAGCRHEMLGAYGDAAMTRDEEDAYFERLDAYETTLHETPAATIEGVIAKLRVAFSRLEPNAWSDHAIMDVNASDFIQGLRRADAFQQMAWGAIEDLARIGGVSLAEQGA